MCDKRAAAARAFQHGASLAEIAKLLGKSKEETDIWLDSPELLAALPVDGAGSRGYRKKRKK